MKILLIHNYYQQRGGEDAVFEAEAQLLLEAGHTIEKLTFHNNMLPSSWKILKMGVNIVYNRISAYQLSTVIKEFQPDVIHVHNFFPIASPAILWVAEQHKIPVVMTLHNFRLICPNALLFREGSVCELCVNQTIPFQGILNGCYRESRLQTASLAFMTSLHKGLKTWRTKVDRYIVLNEFSRQKILNSSLQLVPEQVVVKPNFVFAPSNNDAGIQLERDDYFLFVGRLSFEKGISQLLAAFGKSQYRLKIIGSGPLEAEVRAAQAENPRIEYLGFQDKATILTQLRSARALVLPSTCYENFPMTILEAFSVGTPVITSNHGGLPYIVSDGMNGFLALPGNADSLTEALQRMMTAPNYVQLCLQARECYLSNYTPEINVKLLTDIYRDVLHERSYFTQAGHSGR